MKNIGRCQNCSRAIPKGETLFEIRIDIYAKGGPIEIDRKTSRRTISRR